MNDNDHDNDTGIINVLHLWQVIIAKWKVVCAIVIVVSSVTAIVSLLLPKKYIATTIIMPINASNSVGLAALTGQLGGLSSLMGLSGTGSSPLTQFMALLKTRTLAEQVIQSCNLLPVLFPKESDRPLRVNEDAVKALLAQVRFREEKKEGIITISAEFRDPKLAADVANEYVKGLQGFISENSFTVSKRNRIFIGKQLEDNKRALLEAGKEFNEFYGGNKVSSVESYVDVPVLGGEGFKSVHPRVEFSPIKDSNLHERLKVGFEQLRSKRADLEATLRQPAGGEAFLLDPTTVLSDSAATVTNGKNDEKVVRNVPQQVYLQYLTLHRGLLAQINALLIQQYEMAKISESKDELALQVIDTARIPERRSKPKRTSMVMTSFIISLLVSMFGVVLLDYIKQLRGGQSGQRD